MLPTVTSSLTGLAPATQIRNSVETAVAEQLAATHEEAFNFASYMKERAHLVNEALDKSVPLQYPEIINESMRSVLHHGSGLRRYSFSQYK